MSYPEGAWERAMTVQEVLLKAIAGELHWFAEGLPYQTLIASLLYKYATGRLKEL